MSKIFAQELFNWLKKYNGTVCYLSESHKENKLKKLKILTTKIRENIVNYMQDNKNEFIEFIDDARDPLPNEDNKEMTQPKKDERFNNYCKIMKQSGEHGGQPEIKAAAALLEKQIFIIQDKIENEETIEHPIKQNENAEASFPPIILFQTSSLPNSKEDKLNHYHFILHKDYMNFENFKTLEENNRLRNLVEQVINSNISQTCQDNTIPREAFSSTENKDNIPASLTGIPLAKAPLRLSSTRNNDNITESIESLYDELQVISDSDRENTSENNRFSFLERLIEEGKLDQARSKLFKSLPNFETGDLFLSCHELYKILRYFKQLFIDVPSYKKIYTFYDHISSAVKKLVKSNEEKKKITNDYWNIFLKIFIKINVKLINDKKYDSYQADSILDKLAVDLLEIGDDENAITAIYNCAKIDIIIGITEIENERNKFKENEAFFESNFELSSGLEPNKGGILSATKKHFEKSF